MGQYVINYDMLLSCSSHSCVPDMIFMCNKYFLIERERLEKQNSRADWKKDFEFSKKKILKRRTFFFQILEIQKKISKLTNKQEIISNILQSQDESEHSLSSSESPHSLLSTSDAHLLQPSSNYSFALMLKTQPWITYRYFMKLFIEFSEGDSILLTSAEKENWESVVSLKGKYFSKERLINSLPVTCKEKKNE